MLQGKLIWAFTPGNVLFNDIQVLRQLNQASKFRTLEITIYCYYIFYQVVTIAKIVQNFLEAAKDENNTLLKREDFSESFYEMYHIVY